MTNNSSKNRRRSSQIVNRRAQPPQQPVGQANLNFSHHQVFQSTLPPAVELERMETILPGTLDRLLRTRERELDIMEGQVHHRQELERIVVNANVTTQRKGQLMAFTITIGGLLISAFMAYRGQYLAASGFGSSVVVALATVFLVAKKSDKEERIEKTKILSGQEPPAQIDST